jgi:hypothetical protein
VTLRDLCDVVYVMQVEALERRACALIAAGAEVNPDEMRADFDRDLENETTPEQEAPMSERGRLMRSLMSA